MKRPRHRHESIPPARRGLLTLLLLLTGACSASQPPLEPVRQVDTDRFMGTWYVIAHIPPFFTSDAYNAVERYRRNASGNVDGLYTFNDGAFDGALRTLTPTGYPAVAGEDDGIWGMRFVWPFKSDYRIAYVDDDYEHTIIGRNQRDYVWIMARRPRISPDTYAALVQRTVELGYEEAELRQVPQQPLDERAPVPGTDDFWREQ
jgi:apolipoprotein D and lipocalin family protein